MNCRKAQSLISEYLDECLAEPLCSKLEAHFDGCPACGEELAATRSLVSDLDNLKSPMPFDCWEQIRTRITQPRVSLSRQLWSFVRPAWAVPALAAIVMLFAFLVWPGLLEHGSQTSATVSSPEYATYISAHNRARRQEAFADPTVRFVAAELETAEVGGGR